MLGTKESAGTSRKPKVAIIGAGRSGRKLAERLTSSWEILILDKNPERLKLAAKQAGLAEEKCFLGDATSAIFLEEVQIEKAYQIVVLVSDDKTTEEIVKLLTQRFHRKNIIARILDEVRAEALRNLDIVIVNPFETSVNLIA
ncbi:MAG: hypothetical protein D6767_09195, partial [Candidatus Hydrogenedentota bacterium]